MKQDVLNFKFENKKDFYVTSKNSLAFDLIQKWPKWNNQFFFLYGPTKCGKTTICKIWQKRSKAIFLNKQNLEKFFSNSYKKNLNIHQNWILDKIKFVSIFNKSKTKVHKINLKKKEIINLLLNNGFTVENFFCVENVPFLYQFKVFRHSTQKAKSEKDLRKFGPMLNPIGNFFQKILFSLFPMAMSNNYTLICKRN